MSPGWEAVKVFAVSNFFAHWKKISFFVMIATVVIMAAVLFLPGSGLKPATPQVQSLINAHEICTACRKYAIDHNAMFPPTLDALFPAYLNDRAKLVSPFKPDEPNGYKYTTGLKPPVWPATILIEDKFAPPQHRVVAYADGTARVLDAQLGTGSPSP